MVAFFFKGPRGPCISSRGRAADLQRLDASPVLTLGATMVLYPMISSLEVRYTKIDDTCKVDIHKVMSGDELAGKEIPGC